MSMNGDDLDWFYSLDQSDQDQILAMIDQGHYGYDQPMPQTPYTFGQSFSPEFSQSESELLNYGGGLPPELTKWGEMVPWGMDQEAQATTLQRSRNSLVADQITGAFAGPGAYDIDAFLPKYEYGGDLMEMPGRTAASYYTGLGGGGFQSLIAEAILAGDDPSTAVSKVVSLAAMPDSASLSPEDRAARDAVRRSLPVAPPGSEGGGGMPDMGDIALLQTMNPGMTAQEAMAQLQTPAQDLSPEQQLASQYNLSDLYDFANNLGQQIASDPTGGFMDPATGLTYAGPPKEVWSGTAEKYRDLGIPFPTESYTDDKYIEAMAPTDVGFYQQQAPQIQAADMASELARMAEMAARGDRDTARDAMIRYSTDQRADRYEREHANDPTPFSRATADNWNPMKMFMPQSAQNEIRHAPPTPHPGQPASDIAFDIGLGGGRGDIPQAPRQPNTKGGFTASLGDMFGRDLTGGGPAARAAPAAQASYDDTDYAPYITNDEQGELEITRGRPRTTATEIMRSRQGPGGSRRQPESRTRERLTPQRVRETKRTERRARANSADAYHREWEVRNALPSNWQQRIQAVHAGQQMANAGRTPTQDALLRRLMASQQQGLYGRYPG